MTYNFFRFFMMIIVYTRVWTMKRTWNRALVQGRWLSIHNDGVDTWQPDHLFITRSLASQCFHSPSWSIHRGTNIIPICEYSLCHRMDIPKLFNSHLTSVSALSLAVLSVRVVTSSQIDFEGEFELSSAICTICTMHIFYKMKMWIMCKSFTKWTMWRICNFLIKWTM